MLEKYLIPFKKSRLKRIYCKITHYQCKIGIKFRFKMCIYILKFLNSVIELTLLLKYTENLSQFKIIIICVILHII